MAEQDRGPLWLVIGAARAQDGTMAILASIICLAALVATPVLAAPDDGGRWCAEARATRPEAATARALMALAARLGTPAVPAVWEEVTLEPLGGPRHVRACLPPTRTASRLAQRAVALSARSEHTLARLQNRQADIRSASQRLARARSAALALGLALEAQSHALLAQRLRSDALLEAPAPAAAPAREALLAACDHLRVGLKLHPSIQALPDLALAARQGVGRWRMATLAWPAASPGAEVDAVLEVGPVSEAVPTSGLRSVPVRLWRAEGGAVTSPMAARGTLAQLADGVRGTVEASVWAWLEGPSGLGAPTPRPDGA